jgi:hypothetical protein
MRADGMGRIVRWGALSLMACGAQVDSDYRGERLGALRLALRAGPDDAVPSDTAVGVVWDLIDPEGYSEPTQFGELIDVTGDVPFDVELDLSQPPPEVFLVDMADGNALAVANIRWIDRLGFNNTTTGDTFTIYGSAVANAVVYLAEDVVPEGATSRFLHGTASAGYHLLSIGWPPPPESCWLSTKPDERSFPRHTGTCPRNALTLAPDDLNTTVVVAPGPLLRLVYEDLETAW